MMKLKKTADAKWNGNGMGRGKGEWAVAGHENIVVRNFSNRWVALDMNEFAMLEHRKVFKRIAAADTRKELLVMLAGKLV